MQDTLPPNAAIVLNNSVKSNSQAIAVELKNPKSVGMNSWAFQLKDLEGKLTTGNYTHAVIFIDSVNFGFD